MGDDGNIDISKLPAGAMIDGDGNYVTVKADKAAWNKFQEKVNKSAAAQEEEVRGSRELLDRGLECSIDKRLFVDPVKTPCCQSTYCNECITNALLDDDLRCLHCGKDGVLIDDLKPDSDMLIGIKEYQDEKAKAKKAQELADNEVNRANPATLAKSKSATPEIKKEDDAVGMDVADKESPSASSTEAGSKKRKANTELDNDRASPMPAAAFGEDIKTEEPMLVKEPPRGPKAMRNQGFGPNTTNNNTMSNSFPMNIPTTMPGMNGIMPMMFDPMAMFNQMNAMNQMMGMNGMSTAMGPMNGMLNMQSTPHFQQPQQQNFNGMGGGNGFQTAGVGNHSYRQFNAARPNQEDSAYFRAPVNPHRNNRRNAARPADYVRIPSQRITGHRQRPVLAPELYRSDELTVIIERNLR